MLKPLPRAPRRRCGYLGVLCVSLLCLLLIFASHRFTVMQAEYYSTAPAGAAAALLALAGETGDEGTGGGGGGLAAGGFAEENARWRERYRRKHQQPQRQRARWGVEQPADGAAPAAGVTDLDDTNTLDHAFASAHPNTQPNSPHHSASASGGSVTAPLTTAEIIDAQRARIAADMLNFEYVQPDQQRLAALTPATGGQPARSLIITTWRSGSTFLGDILNAMPANFYHYEPLLNYDIRQLRPADGRAATAAVQQLRQLLACNYSGPAMAEYLEFGATHNYLFNHNQRLWRWCRSRPALCADAAFLGAFCALHPLQSMKVVRLRLELTEALLDARELGDTVRVVLLVRDPRAVLQSRKHREWCPGRADCDRAARLCADMVADWRAWQRMAKRWPGRVRAIRYEDLSAEPFGRTQELLRFYGLPFDVAVEEFLDSHTRADAGGVSSTFRDSRTAPFHWMAELSWMEVREVQRECGEAMRLWGYRVAESRAALRQRVTGVGEGGGWSPLGNVTTMLTT